MDGKPYVSPAQRAVLDSLATAEHLQNISSTQLQTNDSNTTTPLEEELASLATAFAALPVNLEHEQPDDPSTYTEAMASEHASEWTAALKEEFDSLRDLGVYQLVPRSSIPPGRKVMKGRPIFKLKCDQHSNPIRFKARYVCRGYSAVWGQDYTKTSAPTARLESFRILTHLGAALDWEIDQLDIKTTFLHSLLEPD